MKGMEMMIANLLGLKPEELRSQVDQALNLMRTGAEAAAKIQSDLEKIKAHLGIDQEVTHNGERAIVDHGRSTNGNRIEL